MRLAGGFPSAYFQSICCAATVYRICNPLFQTSARADCVAQFQNQRLERCIKYFLRRRPDNTESNTRAVDTQASASLKFNFLDWTANSRSLSGRCSLLIRRLLELESGFCNLFISSKLGHSTFDKYVSINTSMVNQQLWWTCMILAKVFKAVCNGGTQLAKTAIRLMEYPH